MDAQDHVDGLGNGEPLGEILAMMPVGLLVADTTGQLTLINEAAARLLEGRGPTSGRHLREVLPELGGNLQPGRGARSDVLFLRAPGGRHLAIGCVLRWIGAAGGEPRAVIVLHDLSSAYADFGEEQQSMLDALALTMVGSTLHELANPLFGASAGAELLLADPELSETHREAVADIGRELERVTEVADRLRRLGPSKRRARTTRPLSSLVNEAIAYQNDLLLRHALQAEALVDEALPPVAADNTRVVQVLTLVLRDALRSAPGGARLLVEARFLPAEALVEVRLRIGVPGNGASLRPAMPAEESRGATIPFALSLARAAALNVGGDLLVEPTHHGPCWTIKLPTQETDVKATAHRR